ncbi:hypothetical protein [Polyangium jinanense]|uniref:Uncharacterized protein n=1 Tax=Polyangium jinanense TaxID=2829994 RepID=A0A9X4ASX3_9BACT|nr:hypothetical protein [Polyangium jinanense]MDC3958168.1 hypothetical protein [Polyangium jinanense]MDC3983633.1 hypothetical protein [Polyangium jinanense]
MQPMMALPTQDELMEGYLDAYDARMAWRENTHGKLDQDWLNAFFTLENRVYGMRNGTVTHQAAAHAWQQFQAQGVRPRRYVSPAERLARQVYADMNTQFATWDGTSKNRGAWWGSPAPGDTTGATAVPHEVIEYLKFWAPSKGWQFSSSDSGGVSFKRWRDGNSTAFIYHMLPP